MNQRGRGSQARATTSPSASQGGAPQASGDSAHRSITMAGDRLLVRPPDDAERRTRAGILIPATAQSVDKRGIWGPVVAVGPHVRNVDVGDEVLYLPEDAIEVDVRGTTYLVVRERDVHAVASEGGDRATGLYL